MESDRRALLDIISDAIYDHAPDPFTSSYTTAEFVLEALEQAGYRVVRRP